MELSILEFNLFTRFNTSSLIRYYYIRIARIAKEKILLLIKIKAENVMEVMRKLYI